MNANRHLDNGLNRNSSKSGDEGREGGRLVEARVIVSTEISRRDKMSLLFVIHIVQSQKEECIQKVKSAVYWLFLTEPIYDSTRIKQHVYDYYVKNFYERVCFL